MSTIKLKRSAVPGRIPITSNLDLGEIGINTYDGKMFIKKNVGGVETIVTFDGSTSASQSTVYLDSGVGNGTTTNFTLSYPASAKQDIFVYLNGVLQHVTEYEYSGNTLTFDVAPASGDLIEVRIITNISSSVSLRDYKTFVYTFTSSQSTFSGLDDTGVTLAYDTTKVEVYLNGVRLVHNSDFTATNGTSIVLATAVASGTLEVVSLAKAYFPDHDALKPGGAVFTATTANQVADTFPASVYRTAKYLVQMVTSTGFHATEVLLIHNGTTVYMTEYATIFSGSSLGTVDADISGGVVRLLVTPANANTTVKLQRITVAV